MSRLNRLLVLASLASASPAPIEAQANRYFDQTYLPASHNWAFKKAYPEASRLFNAFDYGHAILYETLWRQPAAKADALDDREYAFITTSLLPRPPRVMLDESAIGPEWAKLAPEALMMFEWSHMLHRQIYDVWADDRLKPADKDARIADVIKYYKSRPALAFSSRPKDMDLMEGQRYSLAFRQKFPKFNGLIWSYHWLQMVLYDAMMAGETRDQRNANVAMVVSAFRGMTLAPATLPSVMPMSAAIAPLFTRRYPEASIIFDNLHSLHDVVSDILANPNVPRNEKRRTILAAARHYRDDVTAITSVADWLEMSESMGVEKMGGRPSFAGGRSAPDSARVPQSRH